MTDLLESIRNKLKEISKGYADQRLQYCQLEAASLAGQSCQLVGTALDRATLETVTTALSQDFPTVTFQEDGVKILEQETAVYTTVQTNLTGLFAKATFYSEMVSQLLAGQQLEILNQEKSWSFVRQTDGYLGWAYTPYLTPDAPPPPTHLVYHPSALLYEAPQDDLSPVSRLFAGTTVAVLEEQNGFSQVALPGNSSGWLSNQALRRLTALTNDAAAQRQEMMTLGHALMGVPYLFGGGSALGIDCSGFVQLLHRLVDITLPRDADMQLAAGQPVEPPFQAGDLLFFGRPGGRRSVSHVGMSIGGWQIIHSSRPNNGVYIDDVQEVSWLKDIYAGAVTFIVCK